MRLFWALPAPDAFQAWMAARQDDLRHRVQGARWMDARQAHLTLCFLGELDEGAVPTLLEAGRRALAGRPCLDLDVSGWSAFPRASQARVLALSFAPDPVLVETQDRLARAMAPFSAPGGRAFRPHLTLARFKHSARLPELGGLPPAPAWRATQAGLFRSTLGPGGAVHEGLGAVEFGEPN